MEFGTGSKGGRRVEKDEWPVLVQGGLGVGGGGGGGGGGGIKHDSRGEGGRLVPFVILRKWPKWPVLKRRL